MSPAPSSRTPTWSSCCTARTLYEKESPRAGEADLIVAKHRNGPTDTITVAFQGHYCRFANMATNF